MNSVLQAKGPSAKVRWLVEEQAALRRVATLVARGVPSAEVFAAVAREVGQVLHLPMVAVFRYGEDGTDATVIAAWGTGSHRYQPGTRWPLDGPSLVAEVQRTGSPARIEDYTDVHSTLGAQAREAGLQKAAAAPIIVDSRIWGVIGTSSLGAPLPDDLEDRLAQFTALLATAIANTEAHEEVARLAEEQAALRRVATLVAEGPSPGAVFEAVTAEVAQLVRADGAALNRFEPEGVVTSVGGWTAEGEYVYVGRRYPLEGTVSGVILATGRPARVHNYMDAPGEAPKAARAMGWRSSVGAPITVEGRLWGVLAVISKKEEPLPPDTEERLAGFAELVATAIANAESRDALSQVAAEQAALRRVATLVAEGAEPNEVFAAVRNEVARLLDVPVAVMLRYERDGTACVVATAGDSLDPVGSRRSLDGRGLSEKIFKTGKAARLDDWTDVAGSSSEKARWTGIRWAVGVPIVVDGALWGAMLTASREPKSRATEVEPRLAKFTELLATAVANAEGREELRARSEEQTALRRVATLVARGVPPGEILDAVAAEVARLLGADWAAVERYDDTHRGVPGPGALVARELEIRSSVAAPITVEGRPWGVVVAGWRGESPVTLVDAEARMADFTELVGTAIANAQSRAELDTQRARIVAAADSTRRRIERDLHDGAQQQLLSLALEVRAAQAAVPPDLAAHRTELSRIAERLTDVLDGLREIALGLHPAILAEGGLAPALKTLAHRAPIPVGLDVQVEGRLPEPIEVAAYYVVSEALTNAAKHAEPSLVCVVVEEHGPTLHVEVHDDGNGGADATRGSGLLGLKDRAEALGGSLTLESPLSAGTSLVVELPLEGDPKQVESMVADG